MKPKITIMITLIFLFVFLTGCLTMQKETAITETSIKLDQKNGTATLDNTGMMQRPESVIRDYYSALSLKKFDKAYSYISYQMKQNEVYSFAKDYANYQAYMENELKTISRFDVVSTQITSVEDNLIKVKVDIDAIGKDGSNKKITGTAEMIKFNNEWKILKPY